MLAPPLVGVEARRGPPDLGQHFLGHLLRLRGVPQDPPDDSQDGAGDAVVQPLEGQLVPSRDQAEQLLGGLTQRGPISGAARSAHPGERIRARHEEDCAMFAGPDVE